MGEAAARLRGVDGASLKKHEVLQAGLTWHVSYGSCTVSEGPPFDGLFPNVLCFCHAEKLYYTEDRVGLDEEGWQ